MFSTIPPDVTLARLALTLGEPAGIGPDICVQAAQMTLPAEIVVVGDPDLLLARAKQLALPLTLIPWDPTSPPSPSGQGVLSIYPVTLSAPCTPGTLCVNNAPYVLACLTAAHTLCFTGQCHALVTAPVHKSLIQDSGVPFLGHTEYLAALAGVHDVLMTFHTPSLIVALMTTHIPLHAVSRALTPAVLTRKLEIFIDGLRQWRRSPHPRVGVCGLNPHAGENGHLGYEERDVIIPALETLRNRGVSLLGPLPSDTAFTPAIRDNVDAIVAMYHDQGLAPLKALYFENIVNVTFGLPYWRTSVDHGTALSLAGTGKSSCRSLIYAITMAAGAPK